MPKKGENIYKRKDGRWEGRFIRLREGTTTKYGYVYGKTYSDVKHKLIHAKCNTAKGLTTSNKSVIYSELLDMWLRSVQINIKEATKARYSHLVNTHIRPQLGSYKLSQLSTETIESFISYKLSKGRMDNKGGLSPKTVSDILTVVKSTVEYARYKDYFVACNLKKLSVKKSNKEMRVFSHGEQDALVRILFTDMDLYKFGILLSLYTGIRLGELCALQWKDICIPTSTLKIRKTIQRIQNLDSTDEKKTKIVITEPKSACSSRDIPLPSFIIETAIRFKTDGNAYILSGNDRYVEPRTMQNKFKRYIKECGINDANFHSLRHTFATRCMEVGFEIKSLSEILGHANVNITLDRYVHSSFELKHLNMNKLGLSV